MYSFMRGPSWGKAIFQPSGRPSQRPVPSVSRAATESRGTHARTIETSVALILLLASVTGTRAEARQPGRILGSSTGGQRRARGLMWSFSGLR